MSIVWIDTNMQYIATIQKPAIVSAVVHDGVPCAIRFAILVVLLGLIAAAGRPPASSDSDVYQQIGRHVVVFDCSDIHCFRPLVAVVLEHLPGPSLVKWKAYAVLSLAAAAIAVGRLCLLLGFPARTAGFAVAIAAFGYGPLQSLFDPYTSDPAMYLVAPLIITDLIGGRVQRAGWMGTIGVLAKEFAAAPLWIGSWMAAIERRWQTALRIALAATAATLVWLALQTALMTLYNYRYGDNPSVDLLHGGYFRAWVHALGPLRAAEYLFMALGPLYVLFVAGWSRTTPTLRHLAIASLPAAVAFLYVQQPDRALWNFHFVVIPVAVTVLAELPDAACWAFIGTFAIANLRLGVPQPAFFGPVRVVMIAVSIALAMAAAVKHQRRRHA
jgi:hypothetical protein